MSGGVLSLLGLALRGGRLAVGEEPSALAAKAGQARLLLAASDAAGNTLRRAEHLAEQGHCLWLTLPFSKEELGGALGRGSAAIVALTDTGLAAAVTERLAAQDPERYGEAAARMDLKRRRAKERQSAPRRDPPKKAPPRRAKRRPPEFRREDNPENRSGPPSPNNRRGPKNPEVRRSRDRTPDGGHTPPPHGGSHPYSGKPGPHSGGTRRPGESAHRPHGGTPKGPRSQDARSGGSRPRDGKQPGRDRPYKNRGGPRSGGGRGPGGGR